MTPSSFPKYEISNKPRPFHQSITVRKARDEVEAVPGFFEVDTVARCRPVLKGEFARTLNLTDTPLGGSTPSVFATTPACISGQQSPQPWRVFLSR
jgi:hypothetical protein